MCIVCESSVKARHETSRVQNNEIHLRGGKVVKPLLYTASDINKIADRVYISDGETAQCREILDDYKITHIINMTADIECKFVKHFKYIVFPIEDTVDEDIGVYFDVGIKFINNALKENKNNRVLVHCWAGVSRSASLLVAYLIKKHKITFFDAIDKIRAIRYIRPNYGFIRHLYKFQVKVTGNRELPDDLDPEDFEDLD